MEGLAQEPTALACHITTPDNSSWHQPSGQCSALPSFLSYSWQLNTKVDLEASVAPGQGSRLWSQSCPSWHGHDLSAVRMLTQLPEVWEHKAGRPRGQGVMFHRPKSETQGLRHSYRLGEYRQSNKASLLWTLSCGLGELQISSQVVSTQNWPHSTMTLKFCAKFAQLLLFCTMHSGFTREEIRSSVGCPHVLQKPQLTPLLASNIST